MLRFRLFGFPVTVEPWHWLILAFCSDRLLQLNDREMLLYILLFMVAGFLSILIHELGHALMMRRFGCRQVAIVLHGTGGVAISQGGQFSRGQDILVSLAGPALQATCGIAVLLLMAPGKGNWPPILDQLLILFVIISLFWAILTLVPVYPLDGGQILKGALGPRRIQLTLRISIAAAVTIGILLYLTTSSLLFPIMLGFAAWQNYQMLNHARNHRGW